MIILVISVMRTMDMHMDGASLAGVAGLFLYYVGVYVKRVCGHPPCPLCVCSLMCIGELLKLNLLCRWCLMKCRHRGLTLLEANSMNAGG